MTSAPPWWQTFFDHTYLHLWPPNLNPDRPPPEEVAGIMSLLQPQPGASFLDVPCGHGRIAVPLARRGFRVTGLDWSEPLLDLGRQAATQAAVTVEWHRADMRDIPPEWAGRFDYVVNIFNSFGYFDHESENQRVLEGVARALKPGGRFLIDTSNRDAVVSRYQPRYWHQRDEFFVCEERQFDPIRGVNSTIVRWDEAGKRREIRFEVRPHTPTELTRMVQAAGLQPVAYYGSWAGSDLTTESNSVILIGEKASDGG